MKIDFVTDKGIGKMNEDAYIIADDFFVVIDGITNLQGYQDEKGQTGGYLAAQIVKDVFTKNKDKDFDSIVDLANRSLNRFMEEKKINVDKKGDRVGATAAVVRVKNDIAEYLQIGDCSIVFVHKSGQLKIFTNENNWDKPTLILWKKLSKTKMIEHFSKNKEILSLMIKIRDLANVSYSVLNGENEVKKLMVKGKIPFRDIKLVFLFTDGYSLPQENPEAGEDIEKLTKMSLGKGIAAVTNYIRDVEKSDPYGIKYPRIKSHDDLTAVKIDFSER